jgi:hypothetical protein
MAGSDWSFQVVPTSGEWVLRLIRRLLRVFRRNFTRELWSVPLKCASMTLRPTQDVCLRHENDIALLDLHPGSRTRTPILQRLHIFDTMSANSCPLQLLCAVHRYSIGQVNFFGIRRIRRGSASRVWRPPIACRSASRQIRQAYKLDYMYE